MNDANEGCVRCVRSFRRSTQSLRTDSTTNIAIVGTHCQWLFMDESVVDGVHVAEDGKGWQIMTEEGTGQHRTSDMAVMLCSPMVAVL